MIANPMSSERRAAPGLRDRRLSDSRPPHSRLPDRRLAALVAGCCLFVLIASFPFQTYVMPQLDDETLPLSERVRSGKFGDSFGYGRYAEGILANGELTAIEGEPLLKHMPALPLALAAAFGVLGSVRWFLVGQTLVVFVSLFFFLRKVGGGFPAIAVAFTPVAIALHPSTIKHAAGVMSDLLFGAMLLWVAIMLWKARPGYRDFLGAGVIFGLAVYLRESALPFLLATSLAYCGRDRRRYLGPTTAMLGVFLLLLSPWAARNFMLTGDFVPLTNKSADLFYYSSIPLTTSHYAPLGPGFQETGYDYPQLYETYESETGQWAVPTPGADRSLAARYDPWRERPLPPDPIRAGLRNYVTRPGAQLASLSLKTAALFNKPAFLADLADTGLWPLLVAGNIAQYAAHIGVVLIGIALSFGRRRRLFLFLPYWIGAQYLQALLFWSEERYLMPFYPFLFLIAFSWYCSEWSRTPERGAAQQ